VRMMCALYILACKKDKINFFNLIKLSWEFEVTKDIPRLVNIRLVYFHVFDLRRSLSMDLHDSCDYKLNNRSLEKPIS